MKKNVKKGHILQKTGELNSKVYYVKKGLLRSYTIDGNGREHIFMFAPEGWVIADNQGPEIPTELYIDSLEDSVVVIRSKEITDDSPRVESLIKRIGVLQKRILMMMSLSAIERYQHFVETYPDILQRVPQRMVASYLGVTPETLSAAKAHWRKKKREKPNS